MTHARHSFGIVGIVCAYTEHTLSETHKSFQCADWNSMNNALYIAAHEDPGIKRSEVSIMGPCFFTKEDQTAGAAQDGVLLFGDTTWASGHYNTRPKAVKKYSAYDVLDALVAYYMDRTRFPNLNVMQPKSLTSNSGR